MADRTTLRLCRKAGIMAAIVKTRKETKRPGSRVYDELVKRRFGATRLDELYLRDITEHRTAECK